MCVRRLLPVSEFLTDTTSIWYFVPPLQEWDPSVPGLNVSPESEGKVKDWKLLQDGQHILTTIPALVVGFRMRVYRVEGTTQWFSAISQAFNQETRVRIRAAIMKGKKVTQNIRVQQMIILMHHACSL